MVTELLQIILTVISFYDPQDGLYTGSSTYVLLLQLRPKKLIDFDYISL